MIKISNSLKVILIPVFTQTSNNISPMCRIASHICTISLHMHPLSTCVALSSHACMVFPLMYHLPTHSIFPPHMYPSLTPLSVSYQLDSAVLCSFFGSVMASVSLADKSNFANQSRASRVKYSHQHQGDWNVLQFG